MFKLLFWGSIAFIGYYLYFKPKLEAGKSRQDILDDDDDYVTIKIPKKKKEKSDSEKYSEFEEVD